MHYTYGHICKCQYYTEGLLIPNHCVPKEHNKLMLNVTLLFPSSPHERRKSNPSTMHVKLSTCIHLPNIYCNSFICSLSLSDPPSSVPSEAGFAYPFRSSISSLPLLLEIFNPKLPFSSQPPQVASPGNE